MNCRKLVAIGLWCILMAPPLDVRSEELTWLDVLPAKTEDIQEWGIESIAVDFGQRGLWNYNGSWIQLSRLNPRRMASWGKGKLAVDFGRFGLWVYDGRSWEKIAH